MPRDFPSSTSLPIPASLSLLQASRAPGLFPLLLNFLALTMALCQVLFLVVVWCSQRRLGCQVDLHSYLHCIFKELHVIKGSSVNPETLHARRFHQPYHQFRLATYMYFIHLYIFSHVYVCS